MTISLKVAAGRMLRWNQKGREFAQPQRGAFIVRNVETGSCVACKIGLVMIGRYGMKRATAGAYTPGEESAKLLGKTLNYGPEIDCPVQRCVYFHGRQPLGFTIERLFEAHKWSVNKIDKWLAELAD